MTHTCSCHGASRQLVRQRHPVLIAAILAPAMLFPAPCPGQEAFTADRQVVRMMLSELSLDTLCNCGHVVIDPIVRRSSRLLITPGAPAEPLFQLSRAELNKVREARSVDTLSTMAWPHFQRPVVDTMALAIFVVDTATVASTEEKTLSVFIIAPGVPMRVWSWRAWWCDGRWRGGPLVLAFEP